MSTDLWAKETACLILDGEEVREVFENSKYSNLGRWENLLTIARIAKIAEAQGIHVIVACVSPDKWQRRKVRQMFGSSELIYIKGGKMRSGTHYEEPVLEGARVFIWSKVAEDGKFTFQEMETWEEGAL